MILLVLLLTISADLELEFNLDSPTVNQTYTDAFKITNNNYSSTPAPISFNLSYNFSNTNFFVEKSVNKYTSAKTSNITFTNNSTQTICAEILVNDSNNSNNQVCKTFFEAVDVQENSSENPSANSSSTNSSEIQNTKTSSCDELISFSPPASFENSAKLSYKINLENGNDYEIEYWVENIYGEVVKPPRTSTNSATKTFTPKLAGGYYFYIKYKDCEEKSFFLVEKEAEEKIDYKIDKDSFSLEYSGFKPLEEGIKLLLNEEELYVGDLKEEGKFKLRFEELCDKNEVILKIGEFEYLDILELDDCEEKEIPNTNFVEENNEIKEMKEEIREEIKQVQELLAKEEVEITTPTAAITKISPAETNENFWIYLLLILLCLNAFSDKFKKLKKSLRKNGQERVKGKG